MAYSLAPLPEATSPITSEHTIILMYETSHLVPCERMETRTMVS
jgi:hypothetical protein